MVSVCIATFNGSKYVRSQIESILQNVSVDDEIIISDDGSKDNTIDIVSSYNDPRIVIINGPRQGLVKNFEHALKHANSEFIFISDQDDIWMPNKVRIMNEHLRHYDLVISDAELINENGSTIEESFFKLRNSGPGFIKNIFRNTYLGCCMAFNRKTLERSLPFPANIPMHDMWLGMIAEVFGKTLFCNEKLVSYRRHSLNASPTGGKSCYSALEMIRFRYNLLTALSKRCFLGKLQDLHFSNNRSAN